jgi:thioredoxin-related protein
MENLEKGGRASKEDLENEPGIGEVKTLQIQNEIIHLLKTKGINNGETKNKFEEWNKLKGLDEARDSNDTHKYVVICVEKSEILYHAGFKKEAIELLQNLLLTAESSQDSTYEPYTDMEIIESYIENFSK